MSKITKTPHGVIEFCDELTYEESEKYYEQYLRENDIYRYYYDTPVLYKGVFILHHCGYQHTYVLIAVGRLGTWDINPADKIECWYLERFTMKHDLHDEMIDICRKSIDKLRVE